MVTYGVRADKLPACGVSDFQDSSCYYLVDPPPGPQQFSALMELTWLADTPQSRRRTRALRACSSCQKRKVSDLSLQFDEQR
jgi:hypothetical protein